MYKLRHTYHTRCNCPCQCISFGPITRRAQCINCSGNASLQGTKRENSAHSEFLRCSHVKSPNNWDGNDKYYHVDDDVQYGERIVDLKRIHTMQPWHVSVMANIGRNRDTEEQKCEEETSSPSCGQSDGSPCNVCESGSSENSPVEEKETALSQSQGYDMTSLKDKVYLFMIHQYLQQSIPTGVKI